MTRNKIDARRMGWLAATYAMVLLALVTATGCQTLNPVASAETLEQKVYATYGSFVVFETQAAVLMQMPDVPLEVKKAIQQADAVAKPAADELLATAVRYAELKRGVEAGLTTDEQVVVALTQLSQLYVETSPKIRALIFQVQGVK